MFGATAPITEPARINPSETSSIRRFPYMSPSRPSTGAATAPATSVAVTSHVAVDGDVDNNRGYCGSNGTTMVWINETSRPHDARTTSVTTGRLRRPVTDIGAGSPKHALTERRLHSWNFRAMALGGHPRLGGGSGVLAS